ncbi:MAG: response regulator [Spirochaetota bacterium]
MAKKKILIIDDDPEVLSSLSNTLESGKFHVVTALNSENGYKKFEAEKPCLVIYNIMAEQITRSIDVVKRMRKKNMDVKIYFFGNMNFFTANNLNECTSGVNGILGKPINPDELLEIVKSI